MEFDTFSLVLLETGGADTDDMAVWDGHLAHWADAHERGEAIGFGPAPAEPVRGVCLLTVDPERARELADADPAVVAGVFSARVIPWRVPAGAITRIPDAHFPRTVAEARS